jgi:hypothetical protein
MVSNAVTNGMTCPVLLIIGRHEDDNFFAATRRQGTVLARSRRTHKAGVVYLGHVHLHAQVSDPSQTAGRQGTSRR